MCDNADYDDAAAKDADGHMMPMCRPCVAGDSKSGYVYMTKGQQCNKYIHGVFATKKELSIVVIPWKGCKALPHISHHT